MSEVEGQRGALGPTLGRPGDRLGGDRGATAADVRGGDGPPGDRAAERSSWRSAAARRVPPSGPRTEERWRRAWTRPTGLVELARAHVPEADMRVGDMQFLPYADDAFDVVAGFNSFFFAADIVAALREAGRVAKPGGHVLIQVWGRHERCSLDAIKPIVQAVLPGAPTRTHRHRPTSRSRA